MGGGGGFGQKQHGVVSWGEMTNNKGFFVGVFSGWSSGGLTRDRDFSGCSGRGFGSLNN